MALMVAMYGDIGYRTDGHNIYRISSFPMIIPSIAILLTAIQILSIIIRNLQLRRILQFSHSK